MLAKAAGFVNVQHMNMFTLFLKSLCGSLVFDCSAEAVTLKMKRCGLCGWIIIEGFLPFILYCMLIIKKNQVLFCKHVALTFTMALQLIRTTQAFSQITCASLPKAKNMF